MQKFSKHDDVSRKMFYMEAASSKKMLNLDCEKKSGELMARAVSDLDILLR